MGPRKSAGWVEQVDERVLAFLDDEGLATPRVLASARGIDASVDRVRERCLVLAHAELVAPVHGETYDITRWGQLYLAGELDARHQPTPADVRRRDGR